MTNQMTILHSASIRWNSAIAEYALSSCRATLLLGHKVQLVCLEDSPLQERASQAGIEVTTLGSFGIGQILRAKKLLSDFKPDVIITHGGPETVLFGLAAAGKTPLIRVRGYGVEASNPLTSYLHDAKQLSVKRIVTPSKTLAAQIAKISNIPVTPLMLGIDSQKFMFDADSWNQRKFVDLVIFGRLDPVKGHKEFIEIFAYIKQLWKKYRTSERPLRLKIVGSTENLSAHHIEKFAQEFKLALGDDVVVINERIQNIAQMMSGATVGVISSVGSEIICRVAQEFLLCGTPIVVSGVGSLDESILSPQHGVCYLGLNPEQAALSITKFLADVASEDAATRQNRMESARLKMSLEKMASGWEAVLTDL